MYKHLTAWFTALILAIGSTAATADHDRYRDHKRFNSHHFNTHFHPHPSHKRWQPPGQRLIHIHRHHRQDYSRNNHAGHLGAALLGSAISHTLFHHHNGAVCHDNHGYRNSRDYHHRFNSRNQVVGCHRVERFADGSERRVRVPLSQCR